MSRNTIGLFFTLLIIASCSRVSNRLYFGQVPPGDSAVVLAPNFISMPDRWEPCITFSKDLKTACFYIEHWPQRDTNYVLVTSLKNGSWSAPQKASFSENIYSGEPFFSPTDNDILYLYSSNSAGRIDKLDLSVVSRNDRVWGETKGLGVPPNIYRWQFHPCVVADGSIYFATEKEGDICRSQFKDGKYLPPARLPFPINGANTTKTWGDPYVAPDESYLIFKSTREGGFGQNDIYISYKKHDGSWTNPKNLGPKINTPGDESAGDITPDGKYMTFCSNQDLYWVSSSFIDSLRLTNFIPYLNDSIKTINLKKEEKFKYKFANNIFIDDDENDSLNYSLTKKDSAGLFNWLSFYNQSQMLKGKAVVSGTYKLSLKVKDSAGDSAICNFNVEVD